MTGRDDLPSDVGSDAVQSWLMISRARAVTNRWNARFPKAQVPLEWVEEAALAFAAAETLGATLEGLEAQRYGLEFSVRLPVELLEAIYNGKDLPDGDD